MPRYYCRGRSHDKTPLYLAGTVVVILRRVLFQVTQAGGSFGIVFARIFIYIWVCMFIYLILYVCFCFSFMYICVVIIDYTGITPVVVVVVVEIVIVCVNFPLKHPRLRVEGVRRILSCHRLHVVTFVFVNN